MPTTTKISAFGIATVSDENAHTQPAYLSGYDCAKAGGKITDNPYHSSLVTYHLWSMGFANHQTDAVSQLETKTTEAHAYDANYQRLIKAAYRHGKATAEEGLGSEHNPHQIADPMFAAWDRGHSDGVAEMFKPSPGPFTVYSEIDVVGQRDILDANGDVIATTSGLENDYGDKANALLFAASYQMQEAIRYALNNRHPLNAKAVASVNAKLTAALDASLGQ